MELIFEAQVERTNALRKAFAIVSVIDNYQIESKCNEAELFMDKANNLICKYEKSLQVRQGLVDQIKDITIKFNNVADLAEETREAISQDQEQQSSALFDISDEDIINKKNCNGLEVSPTPTNWGNGFLNTPLPIEHKANQQLQNNRLPSIILLSQKEMLSVPPYMKSRFTCDNVNTFIGTLNSVLTRKYSITTLKGRDVKSKDKIHYHTWRFQEEQYGLKGKIFFTEEDLVDLGSCKMDKATSKLMQILRHTNRLRQSQFPGKIVLYIVI